MIIKHFLPVVAICVVMGALIWSGSEALAAGHCSDARGSTLAMHSRVLCQTLSRRARREHPRWANHVYNECRFVSSNKSWCTWELSWPGHGASCHGEASVVGSAHPRVRYAKETCAA